MPRLRFSLRWLFGVVTLAAMGCALLVYATPMWSKLTFTCTLAALIGAALKAFVRKDARRAFWAGFVGIGIAYLWLVCGSWQMPYGHVPARDWLVTTALLEWCHEKMPHTRSVPPSSPAPMFSGMGGGSGMMGGSMIGGPMGGMPAGMAGAPPGAGLTAPPDIVDFKVVGHSFFALLFAMLGGLLAERGYRAAKAEK